MAFKFKVEMRERCRELCVSPNSLVTMLLEQIVFELCIPLEN